jgi:hypothetical protein
MLQQRTQCGGTYQKGIEHNLSSADSASTNHRGKVQSWFRKQYWEICGTAWFTIVLVE